MAGQATIEAAAWRSELWEDKVLYLTSYYKRALLAILAYTSKFLKLTTTTLQGPLVENAKKGRRGPFSPILKKLLRGKRSSAMRMRVLWRAVSQTN